MAILTAEHCVNEPLPPVRWNVEPLIAQGDSVMLFGRWASYKSWIVLSLGLHMAAGRAWLGFPIHQPLKVWFIDEEMRPRRVQGRVKRLIAGAKLPSDIPFIACSGEGFHAWSSRQVQEFEARLLKETFNANVVVIETLRQTMAGSEDKSEAVAQFWDNLRAIQRDRTVIVSHHTRKPALPQAARFSPRGYRPQDDDMSHEARGSGRLMDHPDVVLGIRRVGEDMGLDAVLLEHLKARDSRLQSPQGIELLFEGDNGPVRLATLDTTRLAL